ncbi:LysR family transcriptional regulator [Pikeienuella piscinae]|uniref:LysR family transcriptional regulator n=1 Tax=Pikeienuella piscinae TaxID=2748098 RepID=A0A7L5BWG0_9RHOB|nr:LysR family transcriptional regulator [Pikeienuella piscinae]QIE56052.1 LysR family transcriptional regulator [Pikeienuella piscinae]
MSLRYTLRQLEYFAAVSDEGSIVRASEKINVSSPSISAAVTQLEQEFGLKLFVRKHAHGLTPTQAGRQFLVQARRVLHEAVELNRLGDNISGNVQGPLNVGCLLTFAQLVVPNLRRRFEEKYPRVEISQIELDQHAIFEALRRAEIDVALTYDLGIPRDITFLPLVELPPFAMMSETHPLAHLPVVSAAELQKYPMLLLDLPHSAEYFLSFFDHLGARPRIAERTRDMAVLRSLAANGFGYAMVNTRPLNDVAPDGRPLKFLPMSGPVRSMQLGIALIGDTEKVLTVKAFIEHCRNSILETEAFRDRKPRQARPVTTRTDGQAD